MAQTKKQKSQMFQDLTDCFGPLRESPVLVRKSDSTKRAKAGVAKKRKQPN
jgi:hypothetical protein